MSDTTMEQTVRAKYAELATRIVEGSSASCCGGSTGCGCGSPGSVSGDSISGGLYDAALVDGLPPDAVAASLGCGNPTAIAELRPGEVVLDLGSGGGIDVFLAARQVGPTGKVYGLDMTSEMLELARANRAKAGVVNVEFLQGSIERIPLPDGSVDVIISNCVVNLATDKAAVLREAFRVLKPGGRVAISDIVVHGELPESVRRDAEAWAGCVAGALGDTECVELLEAAGFVGATVDPTRLHDLAVVAQEAGVPLESIGEAVMPSGQLMSATIRGVKPVA